MVWPFLALLFLLGVSIGSFAHCVASRILSGESWLKNPSYCYHCRKKIKWHQNIPLFSWLVLCGKSACCRQKIPADYFFVEFFSTLVVIGLFVRISRLAEIGGSEFFLILASAILLWVFVLVLGLTDLWSKQLPARWLGWLFLPALLLAYYSNLSFASLALGGGIPFAIFFLIWILSKKTWLGEGDIYLGAALGLSLGWPYGILVLVFAYWLGALISLPFLYFKKWGRKTILPFGPFLILAWLLVFLFQPYFGRWLTLMFGYWRI